MKLLITISLLSTLMFATDYSTMSIDDMSAMRGNVPAEEREAFREAWQSKMQGLSQEERQSYSRGKGMGQQNNTGAATRQRLQDGSGAGMLHQKGQGNGMGRR